MSRTSEPPGVPEPEEQSVYAGLVDATGADAAHWAFGTRAEDPLAGLDTSVPPGLDAGDLARECLALGDDALVLGHRLSEWCSRAPELEEDIALANVALDLLGQARRLLARAAAADPGVLPALPEGAPVAPEDALAFFRGPAQFHSSRMAALPDPDFAQAVVRLFWWASARLAVLARARTHPDPVLAAIAAAGVPEVAYHRDWAASWVLILAQGTEESRRRTLAAVAALAPSYAELLGRHQQVREEVVEVVGELFDRAGLVTPPTASPDSPADRLAGLLAEMQSVARAHPRGRW
ncbi:phenylacetate-CoA oxygenase subunit PaaC [Nocardioides sp. dk4132]|uniref:1,2-phenylacetyl-CoA epoxidase subunit PaaC n=1 Tax=unclassified Nocardioides TaxID=2615069 RepID=UPI001296A07E|nr:MULTISPECIES: 1,2-phenylacetyl-CoA epoxidase subunit PaaC [unclassified Nocardioides]MQW74312.1 phenylacetate-CoA oxygenase subunit PaaC [Nocardioides sp. dk4132]QGA06264.1 phenylacetate-CoA oxygenase subunit PaaC [Nocardioides sp. dk884]